MDDRNDPSMASEHTGDHDSLSATYNVKSNIPWIDHSQPRMDKSDHGGLPVEENIEIDMPWINPSPPEKDEIDHDSIPATEAPDEIDQVSLPPADDSNHKKVVILLVGNKLTDKIGLVNSLTSSGTWDDRKTAVDSSENCVRILSCDSAARIIVDTTPLRNAKGRSPVAIARRWISRNYLRRILDGKDVVVVCVVTCRVKNTCTWDMFSYSNCWVDIFGLIFKHHKSAIMVLVNTEGKDVPKETKDEVARFVLEHGLSPKNITYSDLREGDDSVSTVIEESICQRRIPRDGRSHRYGGSSSRLDSSRVEGDIAIDGRQTPRWKSCWGCRSGRPGTNYIHRSIMPFTITEASIDRERFGPWDPERVILFGRTGSGKSTLAQMLTLGKLDKENKIFVPFAGIRGGTKEVLSGVGRGWYVLDTPGFGEPKDKLSTVPTRLVEDKIKTYVRLVEGTFSHYVYVVKKDRLDILDERLWQFFTALFGEEIKRQFSVVVSDADESWVEKNVGSLKACFIGCDSFLSAEFPSTDDEDEELQKEYEELRTESLVELEEKMATLNRSDMSCKYGRSSKMNVRMETGRANWDLGIERNERIKFLVRGASVIFACCNISQRPFSELTNLLRVNDNITLIPE